uniref:Retrovirus-related Pol polyprotein from transposon TNT 1-94 n=1 Tax=Tanacetum cinerariifolium TaxID=118510 RepID=A0A6L2NA26_TANCI|nr:retrovirus-related Pol polyprotein from transposon TNT 1-94 [Tanacetum cinerariifolium]
MSAPVDNTPKIVYEPKVWTDAPIIEEYESDSDDDSVSNVQENVEKPSFTFTDSVKPIKSPKEIVKETGTPNHYPKIEKQDRHSHTRKGLGYAFTRKSCFVCGSFSNLIRDCDFHEKRMAKQDALTKTQEKDDPHKALKDKGIVDSGCSRHMIGNTAHLANFQEFKGGSVAFRGSNERITGKFNGKSDLGFLVGYSLNSKAFRVYNLETKRAEENLHVNFLENKSNVAGKGHACMFDLDYLTNSMNYEPCSIENQANKSAGPKDANTSAGTQANDDQGANSEEIDLHDKHFVLPIWSTYSTTEELEKLKRQEKEANDAARKEATPENQDAYTNNTNLLNAVNAPINTAGPSKVLNDGEPSYPDDPSMPHLEDIFSSPSEGIFTNSSYDDKAVQTRINMKKNYEAHALSAFLYGTIDEEVYVTQPPSFVDPKFPNKLYKVVKALYGLHQAPRAWYDTLSTFLEKNDIIFGSTKKSWSDEFEELMKNRFYMSFIGELTFFLGLQVKQKEYGIFISQDKYVAEILKKFDFLSVKTASTLIETQKPLVKDEEAADVDVHLYRFMIGSLMYLTASRLDIKFAVCACSRFQVTPKTSHLQAMKRIFSKELASPKQTTLGQTTTSKEISNPLMADSLPKTILLTFIHRICIDMDSPEFSLVYLVVVRNKMQKAFPLPVMELPLQEEVPTASEESSHCQKKKDATAVKIALLLKSRRNCQSKSYDSFTNKYKTAQELWAAILNTFDGNEATKKTKKNLLKQQYGNFKAKGSETLEQTFNRLRNKEVNTASVSTASTNVPTASANIGVIDEDDMEEMDIKWNMALLSMRADRFWKKTEKKISIQRTDVAGFDNSKVKCFNFHKMGHFAREWLAQVESRLAEHRDRELKYYEKIRGLEFKTESNDDYIEILQKELELIKKEKEGLDSKLIGFQTVSKDLDSLLESQRLDKNKKGLGYNDVPPPTQIYSLPKKDMSWTGLPEFKDDTVTDSGRPAPTVESSLDDAQNRNPSVTETEASPTETAKKPSVKYAKQYRKPTKKPNGSSQKNIDDKGYWDSGCSRHMTGNISYLYDYEPFDGGYVSFGQGGSKITGKGTIKTECIVLGRNFKLSDDDNVLLRTPRQHNMYSIDLNNIVPHKDLTCLVAKASIDECMLWHRRLGHLNFKTMNKLVRHNLVRGLPTKCFKNDHTCTACLKGKQHKASCKSKLVNSVSKPLHTLYMDLFGPTSELIEVARTMLADTKLPVTFWAEAVNSACYVQNRVLVNKSQNKTPYELFNGRTPAIGFLKPFGCHVMILNTLDNLGKFEAKRDEGYFIRYSMSSKAFRVFNKQTKRVEENLHVEFLENKAIEKGAGPNWLFDINSLTKSMNCVLVDAGTNSTNLLGTKDAASQEMKKDVYSLRYIALPNWVHDALLESSSSKPQDDCSTDVPESSGNSNPTATSTNPPCDQLETLTVETPIPTVSSPVLTACLNDYSEPSNILGVTTNSVDLDGVEVDMDVKSAFLYGTIDEELYVMQPPGFQDLEFSTKVCKVEKAISSNPQLCREFEARMHEKFQMSAMDALNFFLSLQVIQKEDGIFLSQDKYIGDILKKFGYLDVRSSNTPMDKENP